MRIEQYLHALAPSLRGIAAKSAPREAAGVLTRASQIVEVANRSPEPDHSFEIGPLHDLESREGELMAIWHTHPEDEPPTRPDAANCVATFLPWIIAGPNKIWVLYPEARPYCGREFQYGVDDCWTLLSDWFAQEAAIFLPWFERPPDLWWHEPGPSPYVESAEQYGFTVAPLSEWGLENLKVGDVILMRIRAKRTNHAAIYIGGGYMLHHLYGELSRSELYCPTYQKLTTHVARHHLLA